MRPIILSALVFVTLAQPAIAENAGGGLPSVAAPITVADNRTPETQRLLSGETPEDYLLSLFTEDSFKIDRVKEQDKPAPIPVLVSPN